MIRPFTTSHTELSTLTDCEMRWWLRYGEDVKGEPGPALLLGRLMHTLAGTFQKDGDWRQVLKAEVANAGGGSAEHVDLAYLEDDVFGKAYWLMQRYERHYADDYLLNIVAQELDLKATIPGTGFTHQAIIDEVWRDPAGDLWVVERKTFSDRRRIASVEYDPQLTGNLWVAKENGIDAVGIVFDGIYTKQWVRERPTQASILAELEAEVPRRRSTKADLRALAKVLQAEHPGVDRPDSESFVRLWLDRSDAQIEGALLELEAQVQRRQDLSWGAKPTRNIGPHCDRCDQRGPCLERLAFARPTITILEDE